MAEEILYLTELLGVQVYDLKGRSIGTLRDAALVPLIDPVRLDRFLVGAGPGWLSIRYDQIDTSARGHPPQRRTFDALSLRRIHAAYGSRSTRPADHRYRKAAKSSG